MIVIVNQFKDILQSIFISINRIVRQFGHYYHRKKSNFHQHTLINHQVEHLSIYKVCQVPQN